METLEIKPDENLNIGGCFCDICESIMECLIWSWF